jgi:hypothetical protein
MSPRVIQMPLSGGDRKHYARELRRVESLHAALVKKVEAAHEAAEEHLWLAHRLECEEWNARLFLGGEDAPSPTILAARSMPGHSDHSAQCRPVRPRY